MEYFPDKSLIDYALNNSDQKLCGKSKLEYYELNMPSNNRPYSGITVSILDMEYLDNRIIWLLLPKKIVRYPFRQNINKGGHK